MGSLFPWVVVAQVGCASSLVPGPCSAGPIPCSRCCHLSNTLVLLLCCQAATCAAPEFGNLCLHHIKHPNNELYTMSQPFVRNTDPVGPQLDLASLGCFPELLPEASGTSFRVVTYNILADQYTAQEYAQKVWCTASCLQRSSPLPRASSVPPCMCPFDFLNADCYTGKLLNSVSINGGYDSELYSS